MSYFLTFRNAIFILLLTSPPCIAFDATHAVAKIKQLAETTVKNNIQPPAQGSLQVEASNLDPRLYIAECPSGFKASLPGNQTLQKSATVLIRCDEKNWQIYIRVQLRIMTAVIVATRPLDRGMRLSASDLAVQLVAARLQRGQTHSAIETLLGARVKRAVGMGQAVQNDDVCIVCRDDDVIIQAQHNGLTLITKGTALTDGVVGEQIKVKNNKSQKIINAMVSSLGEVKVRF